MIIKLIKMWDINILFLYNTYFNYDKINKIKININK